jgi:hypothetical protein
MIQVNFTENSKKNLETPFQIIFSTDFTQFIYTNYDFFLILVIYRTHALNDRPF